MVITMVKTAVITGAGGVLCSTFAKALANDGINVALLDLNLEAVQSIEKEITSNGGKAIAVKADVLNRESLEEAYKIVNDSFGKCDILINGAGGNSPKGTTSSEYFDGADVNDDKLTSFFDLDQKGIEFVFNLNFMGTLFPTQVFAKDFIKNGKGNIINISSMNSFKPLTKIPAYSGAKAAVSNFTQWLAVHFANQNIRVNAIAPGFFVTNQNKALLYDENANPTKRTEKILAHTPMRRFGEPQELVGTLKWLVDDNASGFVTGVIIPVDGGFSAYSGV